MEHSLFKFTIRCRIDGDKPPRPAVLSYLTLITNGLEHNSASLDDVYTLPYGELKALSYVKLNTHDYGVIQVGIGIIHCWMYHLFTHHQQGSNVLVEAIVAHPLNDYVSGALIKWDRETDSPIIHELL